MSRALLLWSLVLCSAFAAAKTVSPGNYISMEAEFRGTDQDAARKKLIKEVEKAKILASRPPQIIVLPFEVTSVPAIRKSGGVQSQNALKKQLIRGGAQVVDRSLPSKVSEELAFIEATGASRGVDFDLADFLFKGEVLTATSGNNYSAASSWTDKDGRTIRTPATCTTSASASVSVLFYTMNPLALSRSLVLEGDAKSKVESISATNCGKINHEAKIMDAVRDAMSKNDKQLQDFFSPGGFIIDRRYHQKKGKPEKGKNMIFKTTFKASINTAPGKRILIFKNVAKKDPLTGSVSIEKARIGAGEVLEVQGEDAVWIKMDKNSEAADVLMGDIVEVLNSQKCKKLDFKCHKNTIFK